MKINEQEGAVEAILFANGEPIELKKIANTLCIDEETATNIINNIILRLDNSNSGIQIIKLNDKYQMCTRKQYSEYIKKIMDTKRKTPLTPASMEVLAIIAYNEPVTKAFIEQIRGIDCSYIVGNLIKKELIEERGRLEIPGKPIIYGTTENFLRCFGIQSLECLPEFEQ